MVVLWLPVVLGNWKCALRDQGEVVFLKKKLPTHSSHISLLHVHEVSKLYSLGTSIEIEIREHFVAFWLVRAGNHLLVEADSMAQREGEASWRWWPQKVSVGVAGTRNPEFSCGSSGKCNALSVKSAQDHDFGFRPR